MRSKLAYSALFLIFNLVILPTSLANGDTSLLAVSAPAPAVAAENHHAPALSVDEEDEAILLGNDSDVEDVSAEEEEQERIRQAQPTDGVDILLEDEHAVFGKGLTYETGLVYARFDRRQLLLDGFLALDAIFLGNISVSKIESDTITLFLLTRYSYNPWLQLELYVPFVFRHTVFQKTGQDSDSTVIQSKTVNQGFRIGDIAASAYYKLRSETPTRPDIVVYIQVKSDTGKHPYGIHEKAVGPAIDNFLVPTSVPTGNGLWAATVGASLVKTFDPVVLFFNFGYTYNFQRSFNDLNSDPDIKVGGRVDLGDIYTYGFGVALAMNERIAMNLAFTQAISDKTRIKTDGGSWGRLVDSEGNAATITMGGTFALSNRFSLVGSVGNGLTPDAPNVSVALKLIGYLS